MRAYERFLKYAAVRTPSDEESHTSPSSACQFRLAEILEEELKGLGVKDAKTDEHCYVYGHIPATEGFEDKARLGFIAHMDTVSDFCSHDTVPIVTENYDGKDFPLGNSGRMLQTELFRHLPQLKGRTLITSDGTTILGADDKAGIAEIMTLAERLKAEKIPHGPLSVAFTPDEEIGGGTRHFDFDSFGADFAYTMDGDAEGGIEYENFNACKAVFKVKGVNVHPGTAKDTMVNACLVATEINEMLPKGEVPRETDDYEGFYHLVKMWGDVACAELRYIVRDHDKNNFKARRDKLYQIKKAMNSKWGEGTVSLTVTEEYRNMREIIEKHPHLIENAKKACGRAGVKPVIKPIRGGTDGATLSFKGLPCPNLGTGGYAFHGPFEHITAEGMDKAVDIALELVKIYAE